MARNRHKSQAPNDTRSRSKSAEPVSDAEPQSDDGVSLPSMAGKVTSQTEAEVTNTKDELQKENESGGVSPTHSQDEHKSHGDSALPEPRSQPQKNVSLPNADAEVSTMNSSTLWQPHQREDSPASQNGGVLIDQGAEEQPQGRVNAARTLHPKASFSDSSSMSGRKTPKERLQLTDTVRGASRNRSQARKKKEKNAYLEEKNSERAEFDPRWVHDSERDRSDDQSLSVGNSSSEMLKPRSSLLKDSDSEYENTKSLVLSGNSDDTAASSFRGVPTATMSYAVPWLPHFSGPYPRHFQGSPTPTSQSRGFRGRKNRTDGGEAGPSVYSSKVEEEYSQVGQGLIPTIRVEDFSSQQRVDEYVAAWRPPVSTVQLRGDAESFNPVGNDLRRKIAYLDYYESQNPSLLNAVNSSVVASATGNNFAETPTYHGAQNFTSQDNPLPYSSHQRQNLLSLGSTPFNTRYHGASGQTMPRTHRGSRASRASVAASGGGRATEQDSLIENFQHLGRTGADSQSGLAVHQERPQTPENPDVRAARQNSVDFPFPDDEHPFLQSSPQAQIARNRAAGLDIFGRPLNQSHARLAALREIGYSAEQRAAANQSVLQQRDESQSEQQSSYRPALSVNTSMQNNRDVFGQGGLSSNQELTYGLTPATGGNNELYPRNAFTVVPSQPAAPLGLQGLAPQYGYSPYNQAQIHPQHESQFYQPTQTGGFQPGRTQFGQYHPGQNLTYHYPSGQPASFPTPIGSGRSQVPQHGQTQRGPQRSGYSQFAPSPLDPTPPIQPPYAPPQYPTSSILAPHVPGLPPSAFGGFHPYVPYPGFAEPTGTSTWDPNPPPREAGPDQLGGLRSIWDTVPNLIHPRAPVPGERVHFNEVATAIPRGLTNHPALANVTAETSTSQSPANVTPTTRLAARSTNVTSATSNATPGIIARPATSTVSTAANVTSERGTAPPATNVRSATSITPTAGNLRSARSVALPATTGVVLRLAMLPSDPDWVHPVLRDIAAGNGRLAGAAALQRPYHPGTDAMFPVPSVQGTSVRLQQLIRDGEPSYEKAILPDFFPYIESAKAAEPHKWGVIKITNIPYTVSKQDIVVFLGRNAKILSPNIGEAVHIMMERNTGKSMDCFVEFFSHADATALVNRITRAKEEEGRHIKLAERHVDVELSSQSALMQELFPKAKNVQWNGSVPEVYSTNEPYNSGFKEFITDEELIQMLKYAETPQRFGFSQKSPNRTYENMISVLNKFPWFAVEHYTIHTRDQLFHSTCIMILCLLSTFNTTGQTSQLNEALLKDLLYAGLNAAGFSEKQKCHLVIMADFYGNDVRMSQQCRTWPFFSIGRKVNWDEDVMRYYAQIHNAGMAARAKKPIPISSADPIFEDMKETSWYDSHPHMTMETCALVEWLMLMRILLAALKKQSE